MAEEVFEQADYTYSTLTKRFIKDTTPIYARLDLPLLSDIASTRVFFPFSAQCWQHHFISADLLATHSNCRIHVQPTEGVLLHSDLKAEVNWGLQACSLEADIR